MKFTAIAFDLDGTLYPNYRLYVRLIPFLLKKQRLLRAMDKARTRLRNSGGNYPAESGARQDRGTDFYRRQARFMGEILGENEEKVLEETERLIYRGWEGLFKTIKLFPHAREILDTFRGEGLTMGLLSDFPPKTKLKYLGIDGYWDAVMCSEETGYLKPDRTPFLELAEKMKTLPGRILYVGNSVSYDVAGANAAGMKTALIWPTWRKRRGLNQLADFVFNDYRQLRDYVLG